MRKSAFSDVMTRNVVDVAPQTPFTDVLRTMGRHRISGVPVVGPGGRVLGVVSESDLLRKEELREHPPVLDTPESRDRVRRAEGITAAEIMTSPAVTVEMTATVAEAARLMSVHRITRLPVTHTGRLAGIVTRGDLLKVCFRPDAEIRLELGHLLDGIVDNLDVAVTDGRVTLRGSTDDPGIALHLTRAVEGVIGVTDDLRPS